MMVDGGESRVEVANTPVGVKIAAFMEAVRTSMDGTCKGCPADAAGLCAMNCDCVDVIAQAMGINYGKLLSVLQGRCADGFVIVELTPEDSSLVNEHYNTECEPVDGSAPEEIFARGLAGFAEDHDVVRCEQCRRWVHIDLIAVADDMSLSLCNECVESAEVGS